MLVTDDMVERAAKAMHEFNVLAARREIDNTEFDSSDIPDVFRRLVSDSETSQILVVSSLLEDQIEQVMRLHLKDVKSRTQSERVFGSNGPLSIV